MPLVPYMLSLKMGPTRFLQAVNCSFTLSSFSMAVGLTKLGFLTLQAVFISVLGLIPTYAGTWFGIRARNRLSPEHFRNSVLCMLIILGAALMMRVIPE